MVHTLDLTNEYYYTRIQLNVNPFLQKKAFKFFSFYIVLPPSQGHGG